MTSRRSFIQSISVLAGLVALDSNATFAMEEVATFPINVFSKNLQWLDYRGMADFAAALGFDGIDLTVRPGGHVLPENVKYDLPKAVKIIRNAGLEVKMITTAVTSIVDPHAESILETASALGIESYRMGWINYDLGLSIEENLSSFKARFDQLEKINQRFGIRGEYQNHSGSYFGSAIWDLWNVLKNFNPKNIGVQYDIYHATVEGANAWPIGLRLIKDYISSIDIKDFSWEKTTEGWKHSGKPLGEGMVDFKSFFQTLNTLKMTCPICMHFEYPLGGAENGATQLSIEQEKIRTAMRKDLQKMRDLLS